MWNRRGAVSANGVLLAPNLCPQHLVLVYPRQPGVCLGPNAKGHLHMPLQSTRPYGDEDLAIHGKEAHIQVRTHPKQFSPQESMPLKCSPAIAESRPPASIYACETCLSGLEMCDHARTTTSALPFLRHDHTLTVTDFNTPSERA
jgi:hypothetical protein